MPPAWMPSYMLGGIRRQRLLLSKNSLLSFLSPAKEGFFTSKSNDIGYELVGNDLEGDFEEGILDNDHTPFIMASSRRMSSSSRVRRPSTSAEDDEQLRHLGHKQELNRNFSLFSMLGLGFAILNSWTALAASLSLALPSGGSTSILWGLVAAGSCNLCLSVSLAEFLSAYPTAAGQYHWVYCVSPPKWQPILSWCCGWISTFGWMSLTATAGTLGSQLIVGIISMQNPSYEPQRWQQFLIYILFTVIAFIINAFMGSILPLVTKTSLIWSMGGFAIISITLLACSSGNYQPADFVFRDFVNQTGWPDGIAWLLGLLQAALGLTGYDGVAHCIEEIPHPSREGPKVMIGSVIIGIITGCIFLTVLLFCFTDTKTVISSASGPLLEIFHQSTGSKAGAICLLMFPIICLLFACIAIMTTSSRMIYAFSRDGGLPASRSFAKVHERLEVPLNGLILTSLGVIVFGLIFLGSSSALNAILSASVVSLGVSYAFPVAINVLWGRRLLPESREFKLSSTVGWIANLVGLAFVIITTVLFVFPPELPVNGNNMNYCIVAFFIVIVISTVQWFVDGRKNFTGPRINVEELATGNVIGDDPISVQQVEGQDPTAGDGCKRESSRDHESDKSDGDKSEK